MPTTNTPQTNGECHLTQTHPSDGDAAPVESVNLPLRQLADTQRFLLAHAAMPLANLDFANIADTVDGQYDFRPFYIEGTATHVRDICWCGGAGPNDEGLYLAVGHAEPKGTVDAPLLFYSFDGQVFTPRIVTGNTAQFYGVAHGGPGAYGSKVIAYVGGSSDGGRAYYHSDADPVAALTTWITGALSGDFYGIVWNGSVWCGVGASAAIFTATDAQRLANTFTARTAAASYTGTWRRVIANGSTLIAFGDDGEIQRSTDNGATWTRVHNDAALGSLTQVAVTAAGLVVGTSKANTILISDDGGLTWTEYTCVPTGGTATLGAVTALVTLGQATLAIVESSQGHYAMVSYDGGLTWPATTNFPGRGLVAGYGMKWRAAASDGVGSVLVGGSSDGTTLGAILRTPRRAAFHGA